MVRKYCKQALSFAAAMMLFLAFTAAAAEPTGEVDTDLDAKAPVKKSELGSGELVISAGDGWIPFEYRKTVEPGSALDFSKLSHRHAPAGKFGRVVAKGGHFEFKRLPGVPQRFWGANLCNDANFPDHDTAVMLAERLSAIGYNAVRIHHHEAGLVGAKRCGSATTLNPERADRLDFLVSELFKRGIYIESDLYMTRGLTWKELGFDREGRPKDSRVEKGLVTLLHPPVFSKWCAFARSWLSHRNPYTGRTWAEEPAWIGVSLVNEGFHVFPGGELRQLEPFQAAWRRWIAAKRAADPKCYPELGEDVGSYPNFGWQDMTTTHMVPQACWDFAADVQREFMSKARRFLRDELGFKVSLSNINHAPQSAALGLARAEAFDFLDTHAYESGLARSKPPYPARAANENPFMLHPNNVYDTAFKRVWNLPLVITETNCGAPNPYRGAATLKLASIAAFQGWSGIWRFAYTQGLKHIPEGSVCSPEWYGRFDAIADPLTVLAERVGAALFARGDLAPSDAKLALVLDEKSIHPKGGIALGTTPPWGRDAAWRMGVGETAPNVETPDAVRLSLADAMTSTAVPDVPKSGSVRFDPSNGSFRLATPRAFAAFAESGKVSAGRLNVDFGDRQGTVFLTALDDSTVAKSSRLLFLALVDVQRDGVAYSGPDRKILTRRGEPFSPLVERRRLPVSIALDGAKKCRVHALDISGRRGGEVPCSFDEGFLSFMADTKGPDGKGVLAWEISR